MSSIKESDNSTNMKVKLSYAGNELSQQVYNTHNTNMRQVKRR